MPRQARLDAPGTLHHVMIRGIEGTKIFRNDQDRENFLSRIGPLVDKTGAKVLAWVLMGQSCSSLDFQWAPGDLEIYALPVDRLCYLV